MVKSELVTCEEVQENLQWMLDDELDDAQVMGFEEHINVCSACQVRLEHEGRLRVVVRESAESIVAPMRLRKRLQDALLADERRSTKVGRYWPVAVAAAMLLALVWRGSYDPALRELREAAARHAGNLPMDVVAAEVGPIQSYLRGRLPFNLRLDDITDNSEEPRELGGRVMRLNDRDTAYLRFDSPHGRVSVFVHEGRSVDDGGFGLDGARVYRMGKRQVHVRRVRGFLTARWYDGGLVYSVVADMNEQDLPHIIEQVMRR